MTRVSRLQGYAALAVAVAFIGAGIWWRLGGEPTDAGLGIVAAAGATLVLGAVASAVRSRRG
jgi:hypothetical protein